MWYCNIDSKQYGPVEIEVLQAWARQARLTPNSLVWREGMANWVAADTVAELGGCFIPPTHFMAGYEKKVPSQATTCMVLGILSIVLNCAGLILGLFALSYRRKALQIIRSEPDKYTGEAFCTAGYVMGIIGTVMGSLVLVYLIVWSIMFFSIMGAAFTAHGMH